MSDRLDRFLVRLGFTERPAPLREARPSAEAPEFPPPYTRTRLVGLGYKARQGKDAAAAAILAAFPGRAHRIGFADALKMHCRVAHGMRRKDPALLQRAGVEARTANPWVWVQAVAWAIADLDADATTDQVVVIPDVRFANEFDFIQRRGGILACVRRLGIDGRPLLAADRDPAHVSETAGDFLPWAYQLEAKDGDLSTLQAAAVSLAEIALAGPQP